jgi:hypothetical protein
MSALAAIGAQLKESDWLLALAGLFIAYFVIYPLYIVLLRYSRMNRIKKQTVTSVYKLPFAITPAELAYIFSTKVKREQLYATLLHLANRSVVLIHKKNGKLTVENGPKIESDLQPFETLLLNQIYRKLDPVDAEKVLTGFTSYSLQNGTKINGSRQYVFWWLLRDALRNRNIIQRHLNKRYVGMLMVFGAIGSLIVSVLTVTAVRTVQMVDAGKISIEEIGTSISSSISLWIIAVIPMVFVSFILLKFRGRMVGRDWIMTEKYRRYMTQMEAFRAFVKLTHNDALKFESKELKKEALAVTRPYAIACGFTRI